MKFTQLPMGARFELGGQVYTKTSPISATPAHGGSPRMIPRYAVLNPVGGEPPPKPQRPARQLDEARVMQALESYHLACQRLLQQAETLDAETCRLQLAGVRQAFIDSLAD